MKKALFVIVGGSFRSGGGRWTGGSVNTILGRTDSYDEQKLATLTHLNYIDRLNDQGYKIDIQVGTYKTQYTDELLSWYKTKTSKLEAKLFDFVPNSATFLEKPSGAPGYGLPRMFQITTEGVNLTSYEFLFFIRTDVIIKNMDLFVSKLNVETQQLILPFNLMDPYLSYEGYPWPSDMLMFVPKRLFNKINFSQIELYHSVWKWLIQNTSLTDEDIAYMIDTMHDSDSANDWNPLYRLANRKASTTWPGLGRKYDPKTRTAFSDPNLEETKQLYVYQS
jgi:hypothetical protein